MVLDQNCMRHEVGRLAMALDTAASSDPAGPLLPSGGPTLRLPAPKLTRVARLALPPPRIRALRISRRKRR